MSMYSSICQQLFNASAYDDVEIRWAGRIVFKSSLVAGPVQARVSGFDRVTGLSGSIPI